MLKRTATYHEFLDDTGRRFVVRLASGMQVAVVETALGKERIEWRTEWGHYSPLSEQTAARVVEEFLSLQKRRQPYERLNAELLHPTRQITTTASTAARVRPAGDRQLPAGDRT